MIFRRWLSDIVHVDIDAQPLAGIILRFRMKTNELRFSEMTAGEMPRQLIDGDMVRPVPHRDHWQCHGLVGFARFLAFGRGQHTVLAPDILTIHESVHRPIGQFACSRRPFFSDDLMMCSQGVPFLFRQMDAFGP